MSNPFEALGDQQISNPRKARIRAAEKRALLKVADEKQKLSKVYKKYRAGELEKLLAGPYGAAARQLIDFLRAMDLDSGDDLIALVEAEPWRDADPDTRHEILGLIDRGTIELRERNGLPPFDDDLGFLDADPDPTVFQTIRGALRCD